MDGDRPPCKQNICKRATRAENQISHYYHHMSKEGRNFTYLVVYESSKGKEVEEVGEEAPDIGVTVFSKAFIVKAIYLGDLS